MRKKSKILVGTINEAKIKIVRDFFEGKKYEYEVIPVEVESAIDEQPLDKETTISGSRNRAINAAKSGLEYDFCLGLEGGLVLINGLYHLVCAVSLVDKEDNVYTGISKELPLPQEVSEKIKNGEHFHIIIRQFKRTLHNKELVHELISREKSFKRALDSTFLQYL